MKKFLLALGGLLVVGLIVLRILLPSILKKKINTMLASLPEYTGHVEDVSLALWRGSFALGDLALKHKSEDIQFKTQTLTINIRWLPLFRKQVMGDLSLQRPDLWMVVKKPAQAPEKAKEKAVQANEAAVAKTGKTVPELISEAIPFKIDALYFANGAVRLHVIDAEKKAAEQLKDNEKTSGETEVTLTNINATIVNLTNSEELAEDLTAHGEASALVMGRTPIDLRIRINPLAKYPTFKTSLDIKELNLTTLNPFIEAQFGMTVKNGSFSMFSEATAADGAFKGYVRPLVKELQMVDLSKDKNPLKIIKEAVVGAVAAVLKNKDTERVATDIHFAGRFDDPKTNVWRALLAVLSNAFIRGIAPGYNHKFSPYITAEEKAAAK